MRLSLNGNAVLIAGLMFGCGAEEVPPDWSFNITATTKYDVCIVVAELLKVSNTTTAVQDKTGGYSSVCGPIQSKCGNLDWNWAEPALEQNTVKQELQYDLFFDGANAAVEIDGQPFATGLSIGCDFQYETGTWLEEKPDGPVTWKLESLYTEANGSGVCTIEGDYDWLGIEEITVVDSDNVNYLPGCAYRMAVTGEALVVEE